MERRVYFRIDIDSPVMEVIKDAEAKQREFLASMDTLKREFGAEVWTWENAQFCGLQFARGTPLPDGWRLTEKREYAIPNQRTKRGKELAKRFKDLPRGVDAWRFSLLLESKFEIDYTYHADRMLMFTVYEKYGETYVLSVPVGCLVTPPGCTELKMSEYWELVEEGKNGKVA